MEAGIVGLPNVGKSTLFNALTLSKAAESANYPFCTIEPNEGVVTIPDARLQQICQYIVPQRVIPAVMKLVDIAGIVKGASEGQGLGNKFLSHIRQVDAILQVVRCFEDDDVVHVEGKVDPLSDIFVIETELMFADVESIIGAIPRAQKAARAGDKEAKERLAVLEKCQQWIETEERPLRECDLTENERFSVASFGFLTLKPILYVANVSENDLAGQHPLVERVREHARAANSGVVAVCAKLESEIAELDPADRDEMLSAVGLAEPALAVLAREAYKTLGLQSYFTAGEKEVRAWPIPAGATAPQAAGVIHSDFERGFIRAEVYSVNDLMELKSEKAIKEAGRMRVEGKAYVMQDGDVCHFLVNS